MSGRVSGVPENLPAVSGRLSGVPETSLPCAGGFLAAPQRRGEKK
jgi:hypothetical protein